MAQNSASQQSLLQLHIWGPGFGLPSFDAECLAAIAYLSFSLRRNSWVLVPSNNPHLSPSGKLPLLVDGPYFIPGFISIVDHLRKRPSHPVYLDIHLPPLSRAESKAFSALILSRATPIVDFSLYLDADNYTGATRPLIAEQLRFVTRYTYPQRLRNEALRRSGEKFAGVSVEATTAATGTVSTPSMIRGNAIDAVDPTSTTNLMPTLSTPSRAVTAAAIQKATFQLEKYCHRFFGPISEKLGENGRFLIAGDEEGGPSEADCLALAYLSLCLLPELPNNLVSNLLREKYPKIVTWVESLGPQVFGPAISHKDLLTLTTPQFLPKDEQQARTLQWSSPERGDFVWLANFITETFFGRGNQDKAKLQARLKAEREANETPLERETRLQAERVRRNRRIWNYASVAVGVLGFVGYVAYMHFGAAEEEEGEVEDEEVGENGDVESDEEAEGGEGLNPMQVLYGNIVTGKNMEGARAKEEKEEEEVEEGDDEDIRDALFSQNNDDDDDD